MCLLKTLPHYSSKTARLASLLLLFFLPAGAFAATGEYSVDNIAVDADGKDATAARATALAGGEQEAFKQLVTRINPANAPSILAKTPPATVSSMVRGFEVSEEKITANHYHATLRYNFTPAAIQALSPPPAPPQPQAASPAPQGPALPATPAAVEIPTASPGTDHIRKAVLVLPVYREGNVTKLWDDDNKWRSFWYESALEAGGGLVIAPLGDLDDRVDIDAPTVDKASTATLSRMYGRYGVGEIYILSAFYNLKADPKPALEVTVRRITPTKTEETHMNYTIRSTETLDTLMVRASTDIARYLYKTQTIDPNKIEYERLKDISARVNTTDIREWEELRKHLLTHGNIVGIKLTSISFYETTMVITFKGTPDMLGKTLVASGLRVMQDGDSLVLALR